MIIKWCDFLAEYINYNMIKDISIEISELLPYQKMYVLRNISHPLVYEVVDTDLVKSNDKIYNQDTLIKNYTSYFKNIDIRYSEIIKIEYKNYNWITIFLCYSKNDKYSVISYSPDFNDKNVIKIINDYLDSKNFHTIKNKLMVKNINNDFINNLVKIFRNISGRYFTPRLFTNIKNEFNKFKDEHKEQWELFQKWKLKNLGSSVKCVRYMDIPNNFIFNLVSGETKHMKDLKINDRFYYPISGRDFSQWAEIDTNMKTIKSELMGGISSSNPNIAIVANIPTKSIVFTTKILMYNFSPNVNEREVIVEHDVKDKFDKNIICKIG